MMVASERNKMTNSLGLYDGSEVCGARWTLGVLLLVPLSAVNYGYIAIPAMVVLCIFITIATLINKDLLKLSEILPPPKTSRGRRERNLRSFADFMVMWMTFLSHLVAVAICARMLSATADHVTGGKTRKWLFGYETRALGEPWPDVMGVTVVMIVCAMFMCGLEESIIFSTLLVAILYSFSMGFIFLSTLYIDNSSANFHMFIPISTYELFAATAPMSYTLNIAIPLKDKTIGENLFRKVFIPTACICGLSLLYTNVLQQNRVVNAALPVTTLLEERSIGWACPLIAAATFGAACLALTELCPILFTILVTLASPEWKVLTRSMTYESTTTGSPVLAVFTAGSLAAILAFACPLSHMITLMNASHLIGIAIQAFHFIIMRCVPTTEQIEAGETEERECLLLDEYGGCTVDDVDPCSSVAIEMTTGEVGEAVSDIEASDAELSSGDDSTDIDAVVKEYRDRIQVVTSTPEASAPLPPCVSGARWAAVGAITQVIADAFIATAFYNKTLRVNMFASGIPLWVCGVFISTWQPAHNLTMRKRQNIQGPLGLLLALLLLTPLLLDSWPAITLFAGAGVVIYARCERWCGNLAVQQARSALERRKVSAAAPAHGPRLAHIDAVYITR